MPVRLTESVVAKLKPRVGRKGQRQGHFVTYDVRDEVQPGLVVRVRASGHKSYVVRLQNPSTGNWYWWSLGPVDGLTPEAAREAASSARGQAAKAKHGMALDPREERQHQHAEAKRAVTLRTFLEDQYAPYVRTHQKRGEETLTTITNRCADFLDLPLTEITPFAVERWRSAYLKHDKKSGKPASPATVNRVLNALKACLAKAAEWRILDRHPLAGLKLASVDRIGRLRYLTPDEETRLLAALTARDNTRRDARAHHNEWLRERGYPERPLYRTYTDHLTPLVTTLLHTGLRFGEACGLTWADVDLVDALLTVRGETAKTNTTRHVPLNKTACDTLKAWKPEKVEVDAYVFPGREDGQKLTDIKTAWRELLKNVDGKAIAGFRVHDLRHTFASKLVQSGVDLNTVRELLGHTDIKMTLRYSHLAPKHLAEAVAKVG